MTAYVAPETRQYPTYSDQPHTKGYAVGGKHIQEVVFEVWFPALSRYFGVNVHWTLAFEFWSANPTARVSAVRWASQYGGQAEGYSYAYARFRASGDGRRVRYIVVGASEAFGLVEILPTLLGPAEAPRR
jgi:hypothetical protein